MCCCLLCVTSSMFVSVCVRYSLCLCCYVCLIVAFVVCSFIRLIVCCACCAFRLRLLFLFWCVRVCLLSSTHLRCLCVCVFPHFFNVFVVVVVVYCVLVFVGALFVFL